MTPVEDAFRRIADRLTLALTGGDFGLYRSLMALPLTITPRGGRVYVLENETDLRHDFDLYHAAIRTSGVTDIFRDVQEMRHDPEGRLRVRFKVHLLARSQRLADPFLSEMLLVAGPGDLLIAEITSSAEHIDWTLGRGALGHGAGLI